MWHMRAPASLRSSEACTTMAEPIPALLAGSATPTQPMVAMSSPSIGQNTEQRPGLARQQDRFAALLEEAEPLRKVALLEGQRLSQVAGFGDGHPHAGGRKAFTYPVGRHVTVQVSGQVGDPMVPHPASALEELDGGGKVGRHPRPDVALATAPQVHPADTGCPESAGSRLQERGPDPAALPVRVDEQVEDAPGQVDGHGAGDITVLLGHQPGADQVEAIRQQRPRWRQRDMAQPFEGGSVSRGMDVSEVHRSNMDERPQRRKQYRRAQGRRAGHDAAGRSTDLERSSRSSSRGCAELSSDWPSLTDPGLTRRHRRDP